MFVYFEIFPDRVLLQQTHQRYWRKDNDTSYNNITTRKPGPLDLTKEKPDLVQEAPEEMEQITGEWEWEVDIGGRS